MLASLIDKMDRLFTGLWAKVEGAFTGLMDSVSEFIRSVADRVSEVWDGLVTTVSDFVGYAVEQVKSLAAAAVAAVQDMARELAEPVLLALGKIVERVTATIKASSETIEAEWKRLVTGAESIIDSVNDRISGMAEAVKTAATDLTGLFAKLTDEQIAPFVDAVKEMLSSLSSVVDPKTYQEVEAGVLGAIAPGTLQLRGSEGFDRFFKTMVPKAPVSRALFYLLFGAFVVKGVFAGVVDANAQVLLQEFGKQHPYQVLSVADAVTAYRLGSIDKEKVLETIRASGFAAEDAAIVINNARGPLAPGETIQAWNRGDITDDEATKALKAAGLDDRAIALAFKLAKVIPPASDLITMAVREAFSPDVVAKFGQDQDFPAPFGEWAEKQGLSKEWALKYWAAHWSLPSPSQGFEMLHRGIITEPELEMLLRALDVMPFWRAKLTDIAYHVPTRVDVRRMHQVGVITDEDLPRRYQAMGYSPADAATLAEFTLKLNSRKRPTPDEALGQLTRANIVGFYTDGLVTKERALALLVNIGVTPEAAALYLSSADVTEHRSERKAAAAHIVELALAGMVTKDQAETQLRSLGLEQVEVDRALTQILRGVERKQKAPSLEQATAFHKAGLLRDDEFLELAIKNGYSARWAGLFLQLAKKKADGTKKA
jgi:hypothetical protein